MSASTSITPQGQGFVTASPIAKFYSLTVPTIYRWAHEGKIPSVRFQSTIRFDFAAVRRAIEGPAPEAAAVAGAGK